MSLKISARARVPFTFPMSAKIDRQNVKTKRVPQRRPPNRANFRVGVSVQENRGLVTGDGRRNPPARNLQGSAGSIVPNSKFHVGKQQLQIGRR